MIKIQFSYIKYTLSFGLKPNTYHSNLINHIDFTHDEVFQASIPNKLQFVLQGTLS